jgi:2,3-bisphosphoglycerate-independent phosphoglycerate mutase
VSLEPRTSPGEPVRQVGFQGPHASYCEGSRPPTDGIPQFGLVAEQVEKVSPDLVARDEQGKPYTVRYEAVNAMLLNEFLKEHRKVEEQARINQQQEARIAGQQKEIAALTESVKAQAAQIQSVSDQLSTGSCSSCRGE